MQRRALQPSALQKELALHLEPLLALEEILHVHQYASETHAVSLTVDCLD